MKRIGRALVRAIYWRTLFCLFALPIAMAIVANGIQQPGALKLFRSITPLLWFLFWAWLLLGRTIATWLLPLLISTVQCPGCSEEIDAVGLWRCACGFHDFRERHVMGDSCPLCGKQAGHINCPRCDCTILLW